MTELTARRGRRSKKQLKEFKETGRYVYWKLKEEALDRILWRTDFGRGYGSAIRQCDDADDADDNDVGFINSRKIFLFETFAKRNP